MEETKKWQWTGQWTTKAGISENFTLRNDDKVELILDREEVMKKYAPTAKFLDDDDNEVTENLGKCKDCGADNIRYKSGKVGCSKYCWNRKG